MKVLIVGGGGLLGQKLIEVFRRETDYPLLSVIRTGIADAQGAAFFNTFARSEWKKITLQERWRPDVIINAADAGCCGDVEPENRESMWKSRVTLVELLADVCRRIDSQLVQISCDSVFDGRSGPYNEEATPQPVTYEGRAKLAAENICRRTGIRHTILRTMWLYGDADAKSSPLVQRVERSLIHGTPLAVDPLHIGTPTLTDDVAYAAVRTVETGFDGVVHVAGPDVVSEAEFASMLARAATRGRADQLAICPTSGAQPRRSGLISLFAMTSLHVRPLALSAGLESFYVQRERRARNLH